MRDSLSCIQNVGWKVVRAEFAIKDRVKTGEKPFHFIFNDLVKQITHSITSCYSYTENIIYHLDDAFYKKHPKVGDVFFAEFIFTGKSIELADVWRKIFLQFFSEENRFHSLKLIKCHESVSRSFSEEWDNLPENIKNAEKLELDFISFYETNVTDKKLSATYIDSAVFTKQLRLRIKNMTGVEVPRIDESAYELDFSKWKFVQTPKDSVSQKGHKHLIGGCTGSLIIKGNLSSILPYIVLCSHLHTGGMKAFSQGYFKIKNPFQESMVIKLVNLDLMTEVYESVSMYAGHQKEDLQCLISDVVTGKYRPEPAKTFRIKDDKNKTREIEKSDVRDMILQKHLANILSERFENSTKKREEVIDFVKDAVDEGFFYCLETDIDDFLPSVDHEKLLGILEKAIPEHDSLITSLISKIIKRSVLDDRLEITPEKGLAVGSPLSQVLANIYLDSFDDAISELDIRYIRYNDDILIFTRSEKDARSAFYWIRDLLREIGLEPDIANTDVFHIDDGVGFLGYIFNSDGDIEQGGGINPYKKTLYISEPNCSVGISHNRIEVSRKSEVINSVPVSRISEVIVSSVSSISTHLISRMISEKIPFTMILPDGKNSVTVSKDRREDYETSASHYVHHKMLSDAEMLAVAKMVFELKAESYMVMMRKKKVKAEFFYNAQNIMRELDGAVTTSEVMGLEGVFARLVFERYREMIRVDGFNFDKRGRMETDRFNSLLNFASYILFGRIKSVLQIFGLNPYLGFLHSDKGRYASLAADIQEFYRAETEGFIINVVNRKEIQIEDFRKSSDGRYFLNYAAANRFRMKYEDVLLSTNRVGDVSIKDSITANIRMLKHWALEGDFYGFRL